MIDQEFVCPQCRGGLVKDKDGYLCQSCQAAWKMRSGVPVFSKSYIYWGGITQGNAEKMNRQSEKIGWRNAIKEFFSKGQQEYILSKDRAKWKYLVDSNTRGRVLDAGSGDGTLAFSLAKDCVRAYALEPVWERLDFIRIRKEQDGVTNLQPVCGDVLNLPFPDNYFDVVSLNGVVEWLGLSDATISPDQVQLKALEGVFRVLKPGGSVYIAIENRLAFFYFFGVRDPHSRLRFATLMPRVMANSYSRIVKKEDYRTYIYSVPGYRKLLSRAGFKKICFYTPVPGYTNFKYIIPIDWSGPLRYFALDILRARILFSSFLIKTIFVVVKIFFKTPFKKLSKYFVPDYSIIAVKEKRNEK